MSNTNTHPRINDQDGLCETCLSIARSIVSMSGGVLSRTVIEVQNRNHSKHRVYVNDRSANDRWRAICSCGFRSLSYATRTAAEYEAELHATTANHSTH